MFVGRKQEMEFLNSKYQSDKAELIVLYGRRRVGKTETLKKFSEGKRTVFYSCRECSDSIQLEEFSKRVLSLNPEAGKYINSFKDWADAISFVADCKAEEKTILIIDEFPYMCKGNKSIPSTLQNLWDHKLKDANIMIIISGSSVSFIEDELLGAKNPLYGRATGIFKMEPLPFEDAVKFFPNYSSEDKFMSYAILGGIPHYLMQFNPEASLETNIKENILKKGCVLYDEVEFLLHEELRETAIYNSIIQAIAVGNCTLNEIYTKTQIDKAKLSVYLKNLIELGIIVREFPVDVALSNKANVNRGEYHLTDNYFKFWYAYMYSHYSDIEKGDIDYLWDYVIKNELHSFASKSFEEISIDYMRKLRRSNELPFAFDSIGRWWGKVTGKDEHGKLLSKSEEIDILAVDRSGENFIIGECKLTNSPFDMAQLNGLKDKFLPPGNVYYYLFSLNGFTKAVKEEAAKENNIILITLDEMLVKM